jgi:RNA polymerase-interacting CarD/CdnL/TRCF family regulator
LSALTEPISESKTDLKLAVGALVVYGSYGIGTILSRKKNSTAAASGEMVVIEFANGLSVTLPVDRAAECLRPLAGKSEVAAVAKTLRAKGVTEDDSWQRRTKTAKGKLVAGDAVALAEIVRNAFRRDGQTSPSGSTIKLSAYERELYLEARQLLAAELGISKGVDEKAADKWIGEQLSQDRDSTPALV